MMDDVPFQRQMTLENIYYIIRTPDLGKNKNQEREVIVAKHTNRSEKSAKKKETNTMYGANQPCPSTFGSLVSVSISIGVVGAFAGEAGTSAVPFPLLFLGISWALGRRLDSGPPLLPDWMRNEDVNSSCLGAGGIGERHFGDLQTVGWPGPIPSSSQPSSSLHVASLFRRLVRSGRSCGYAKLDMDQSG